MPGMRQTRNWREKMHQHYHNSLYGRVKMMQQQARAIASATSVTPEGREYAVAIINLLDLLEPQVYSYRVNLDGTTVEIKHKQENV